MVVRLCDGILYILMPVFYVFGTKQAFYIENVFRRSRHLCRCQLSPTLVLRDFNISSSYVGASNRKTKLWDTRKNCNRTNGLQHFPQRAQSITAEAVLADKAQTCQSSNEELLPTDNYQRELTEHIYGERQSRQL